MQLTDQSAELHYTTEGYVKLDHFLEPAQLDALNQLYKSVRFGDTGGKMYSNIQYLGYEKSVFIEQEILSICRDALEKNLSGYEAVGAGFIIKGIGNDSDSRLHQDWTIVDEKKYRSALLWIPLMDVDETNGCLQVMPASHRWFHTFRSSTVSSLFLKFEKTLNRHLRALPMKAGEAALFYMKIFHGSKPNFSQSLRPAITITLIDEKASYLHCLMEDDRSIKVVECNKEFMYAHAFHLADPHAASDLKVLDVIPDSSKFMLTKKDFYKKLQAIHPPKAWWNKLIHRLTG